MSDDFAVFLAVVLGVTAVLALLLFGGLWLVFTFPQVLDWL